MKLRLLTLLLAIAYAGGAQAQQNSVPSCYAANVMEVKIPVPKKAVFLMIDETTLFNNGLRAAAWEAVTPLLQPGTSLTVVRFSAFSQSRYTSTSFSGLQEEGIPESARHAISVKKLKSFDECLKGQQSFVRGRLQAVMIEAFNKGSADLAKSDVVAAMKDISVAMKATPGVDKILFVMSDMLENSSISSFYEAKGVRKIDSKAEIEKVKKVEMLGDYGGARVWIMGAGLVSEEGSNKGVYRDPIRLNALNAFWTDYFKKSNATLVEFGTPELKQVIR